MPFLVVLPSGVAVAADGDLCYVVATGTSHVFSIPKVGGAGTVEANTANGVSGLAFAPDGTLLGTLPSTTRLGTIDLTTGAFTARPSTYGTTSAPTAVPLDNVIAIAVDGANGALFAIHQVAAGDDLLVRIDAATGQFVPGSFGGDDYLVLRRPDDSDSSEVMDLTVRPSDGVIAFVDDDSSGDHLGTVDPVTGTVTSEGLITHDPGTGAVILDGVEGVSFDGSGQLYINTASDSTYPRSFFAVAAGASTTFLGDFGSAGGHRGLACGSETPSTVSGTVWEDVDASGARDGSEGGGPAGVTVQLLDGSTVVQEATTGASGTYSFSLRATGTFTVAIDASTLPAGSGASPPTSHDVAVTASGSTVPAQDLAYRYASIGGVVWNDVDGDGTRDAGEPGFAGVTLAVSDGTSTSTTSTASDGSYGVYGLAGGSHTVDVEEATLPSGTGPATTTEPLPVTVAAGEDVADAHIGYDGGGSISGTVWNDLDGDGLHDAGEPPLAGAEVSVSGPTIATRTTGTGGTYSFPVAPGSHTVTLDSAPGTATSDTSLSVAVSAGEDETGHDFLSDASGDVTATAFEDGDGDGDPSGDPALAGVGVQLSQAGSVVASATTDESGALSIADLEAGSYDVTVTGPDGAVATTVPPATVSVDVGATAAIGPLGFRFATVGGTVWNDLDGEGDFDETDTLSGVTVELWQGGSQVATTTTLSDGTYGFGRLDGGTYEVVVDGDGRGTPTTGSPAGTHAVTIADGEHLDRHVGVDASITIPVTVYNDLDGDGTRDTDEPGIAGVSVDLTDGTTSWRVVTDASGDASFTGLHAGSYTRDVDETTLPNSAALTSSNDPHVHSLADGETAATQIEVGYDGSVEVAGTVFNDLDGDAVAGSSEPRYQGVTVELRDGTGTTLLDTTTTDAVGSYSFGDLLPGDYTIAVDRGTVIPAGATRTTPATEPAPTGPLGFAAPTEIIHFGYDASADVTVRLWNDLDGEGDQDESEILVAVDVQLLDSGGAVVRGPTATDASGEISFGGLEAGDYRIDIVDATVPTGATLTSHAFEPIDITLTPLADPTINVGYDASVELGGRVWNDLDASTTDDAEPGLSGVRVILRDGSGTFLADTTTDGDGGYGFADRAPGAYVVEVDETTVPSGALRTEPTTNQRTVTLAEGQTDDSLDFGYDASASVGDLVWEDLDGDGIQDAGEPGIAGVTVHLLDGGGTATGLTATTDLDGLYRFDDLAPGLGYQVEADPSSASLSGYVATTPNPVTTTDPLAPVEIDATLDLGFWRPAHVTGDVFEDSNGDTVRDAGEAGVADVTIELWSDPNGDGDHGDDGSHLVTTATSGGGSYSFGDLPPADYVAVVVVPSRHVVTTPNAAGMHPFSLVPGETATLADTGLQPWIGDPRLDTTTTTAETEVTQTATYPFTLTNDGNVPDTFDLDASSTESYAVTITTAADPGTAVGQVGPLDPGASVALALHITVAGDADRGTVDTTSLTATSHVGTDEDPDQDTAVEVISVATTVIAPALSITKWSGPGPDPGFVTPGQRLPYTVEITNAAGSDVATARDVELDDTPSHGTIDLATVAVNGLDVAPDPAFPLALGDLPPDTTVTVTFDVVLPSPLPDGTAVSNHAEAVPAGNPEPSDETLTVSTVSETDTVESAPLANVTLAAAPGSGQLVEPGQTITYTVVVGNRADATDTWRDVTMNFDPTPSGAILVSGATSQPLGDLAPGDTATAALTYRVDDPVPPGTTLTAIAWANGDNGSDTSGATTHTVDVRPSVDLGPDHSVQAGPGDQVIHGHTLTNTGNVTDGYDLAATSDRGWPVAVYLDGDGDGRPDPGEVATEVTSLTPGATAPLLVEIQVPAGEPDGMTGATTLMASSQTHASTEDAAFDLITVADGELTLTKSASPASSAINPGQRVSYTLVVSNPGGATTPGVVVADEIPVPATYIEGSTRLDGVPVADGPPGTRNPLAGANGGLDVGDLPPGTSRTITFAVDVRSSVPDGTPLTNTANAESSDGLAASDSVTQLITASPVLDVSATAAPAPPGPVTARDRITYRLEIANVGNAPATGTTLFSELPTHTRYIAGSATLDGAPISDPASGPPTASANGGLLLGRLEADGTEIVVSYEVEVLDPVADGDEISQTATLTTDQGVRAATPTLTHQVDVTPEVTLTPDGAADVPPPGQVAYPHVVTNGGDVTDTYDLAATSERSWTVSLLLDDDADGAWDAASETTSVSTTGALAPGEFLRFFVVVTVPAGTTSGVTDVTSVTATSQADPTVVATAIDVTQAVAPLLIFEKAARPSADVIEPGGEITYQLIVQNRGLAAATDLVVTDSTPSGAIFRTGSVTRDGTPIPDGSSADGNPLDPVNGGITIASLPARTQTVIGFTVDVPVDATSGATITNQATLDLGAAGAINETRTHTVSGGPILHVEKVADRSEMAHVTANDHLTYTVTVTNTGPVTATDVRLVDEVPASTSLAAGSASLASPGVSLGNLAPGESRSATVTVVVDDPIADGAVIENIATATGSSGFLAASRTLRHDVDVTPVVALSEGGTSNGPAGGVALHSHILTNTGDVSDSYALAAASSGGWPTAVYPDPDGDGVPAAGAPVVTATPQLAPGETYPLVVQVSIPETAEPGSLDRLWVTARSRTSSAVRDGVVDQTRVVRPRLVLDKQASPDVLTPGDRATYTLTLVNAGQATATGVVLLDSVPAGTTYVTGSTRRDGASVADVDGGLPLVPGLAIGSLAPGEETVVTFEVDAGTDLDRNFIINVAEAVAGNTDGALAGTAQRFSFDHALDLSGSQHVVAAPGSEVVHPHALTNSGDAPDEVIVSAVSSFGLPVALHADVDGDGRLDPRDPELAETLTLPVDGTTRFLAVVSYPANAPDGIVDEVSVTATSLSDPDVAVTALNRATIVAPTLTLTKSSTPEGTVPVGGVIRYRVVVSNDGSGSATEVQLVDALPAGTSYVTGSIEIDGRPYADGGVFTLAKGLGLGQIDPGTSRTVDFSVEVNRDVTAGALIVNVASAEAVDAAVAFSNLVTSLVAEEARLVVDKRVDPAGLVAPGQVVTWTLVITNVGTATAQEVVIVDPPVPGSAYVPGSTTLDGHTMGDDAALGDGLAIGSIAPGGVRTLQFRWQVQTVGAAIDNVASVRFAGAQAVVLSNVAGVSVDSGAPLLPLTGASTPRTLGVAATAIAFGWVLLYVARPPRPPLPIPRRKRPHR